MPHFQYVLKPTYTPEYIQQIDKNTKMSRAFDGTTYYPGIIGLNNIKANDYANVILHVGYINSILSCLIHVI